MINVYIYIGGTGLYSNILITLMCHDKRLLIIIKKSIVKDYFYS